MLNKRTGSQGAGRAGWVIMACVFMFCRPAFAERFLVKDGQAQAEIVIAENPARMTKLAAQELQAYIEKISGAKRAITNEASNQMPVKIYVGKNKYTDQLNITDEGLHHGAFRMVAGDDYLILMGHDSDFTPKEPYNQGFSAETMKKLYQDWDALTGATWVNPMTGRCKEYNNTLKIWEQDERGSFNAVGEFLRMQGVRWYLPDALGEIIPRKTTIELPAVNKTVRPDFALRYPFQYGKKFGGTTPAEVMWQLRLGINMAPEVMGDLGASLAHGINYVHGRDETKKAHPEYYALIGGKRDTETYGSGRPCLSSQGLLEANVKFARAMYKIYDAPMVSVMPQDGYIYPCGCDLCKGKATPERGWNGQISDYVFDYASRVAREAYKTHPDKKISCFAYGAYLLPPTNISTFSPNMVIGIAQHRNDPNEKLKFADLRKAWLDKMPEGHKQLFIYDYYRDGINSPNMPMFFPHAIAEDLRSLKGISMGEFIEVYRDKQGIGSLAVDHLNLYVTARCWWDANQDIEALLNEYYEKFYGPARKEMKAFIEYCEYDGRIGLGKSAEKIGTVFELLGKAQQKVPADSVYGQRIKLIADYIRPLKDLRDRLARGRENDLPRIGRTFEGKQADIKIDGKLDDKFWKDALWDSRGSLNELQTGRAPAMGTSFTVGWADNALYFGIRCGERDTKGMRITATNADDLAIREGDMVELLIETQVHSYYQITINPAGAMMDADRKNGTNTLWSSGAEVAAFIGDGFWSVEVRIPMAGDLAEAVDPLNGVVGYKPNTLYPWSFNLCRQRVRERGTERSAFSPTGKPDFHDPMKFGTLVAQ